MNYKRIIKNRKLRLKLLELLSFVPDKKMVQLQYRIKTGRKLDLKDPLRFTEKLQWYKLNYRDPQMIRCVDKYDVRSYVRDKGFEDILIPCIGVFDSSEEISWSELPNQFVIKDTLGGGGSSVIIVKDKKNLDYGELNQKLKSWIDIDAHRKSGGREWPYYSGKKHRIIIEEFLEEVDNSETPTEYKFFCFNGKPKWVYVLADRRLGEGVKLGIYDSDFIKQDAYRKDEKPLNKTVQKPPSYTKMKEVATALSEDFPEARIDLYDLNGTIRFGEITFFDGSGYMTFEPDEFDFEMGKDFILPERKENGVC